MCEAHEKSSLQSFTMFIQVFSSNALFRVHVTTGWKRHKKTTMMMKRCKKSRRFQCVCDVTIISSFLHFFSLFRSSFSLSRVSLKVETGKLFRVCISSSTFQAIAIVLRVRWAIKATLLCWEKKGTLNGWRVILCRFFFVFYLQPKTKKKTNSMFIYFYFLIFLFLVYLLCFFARWKGSKKEGQILSRVVDDFFFCCEIILFIKSKSKKL